HLQQVHRGVFDDARLQVEFGDGSAFVEQLAGRPDGERFDLVVLDLTDPDTPAQALYTREFFEHAKAVLRPGGAVMLHIGSPVFKPERVQQLTALLSQVFAIVRPLGLHVPLYGAYWGMACASDSLDPLAIDPETVEQRLLERGIGDLQYYNGDVHR